MRKQQHNGSGELGGTCLALDSKIGAFQGLHAVAHALGAIVLVLLALELEGLDLVQDIGGHEGLDLVVAAVLQLRGTGTVSGTGTVNGTGTVTGVSSIYSGLPGADSSDVAQAP
jgi:hypothetical protein